MLVRSLILQNSSKQAVAERLLKYILSVSLFLQLISQPLIRIGSIALLAETRKKLREGLQSKV